MTEILHQKRDPDYFRALLGVAVRDIMVVIGKRPTEEPTSLVVPLAYACFFGTMGEYFETEGEAEKYPSRTDMAIAVANRYHAEIKKVLETTRDKEVEMDVMLEVLRSALDRSNKG